jgi:Zn-dependent M16 (insulinase) family peptidase
VFGPLIRRFLLGNKHRVSVVMLPDSSLAAKTEESERAKLDSIRAQLSEQEVSQQEHVIYKFLIAQYACMHQLGGVLPELQASVSHTVHAVLS